MKFSTRDRYALRLMAELARYAPGTTVSLKEISERQNLSLKYLEQIVTPLARVGLVKSERGSQGGADKFRCLFHGGLLNHSKTRQCRNVLIIHEFCVQGMDFSKKFADLRLFRMGSAIFTA